MKTELQDLADRLQGYGDDGWEIARAEKVKLNNNCAHWELVVIRQKTEAENESDKQA